MEFLNTVIGGFLAGALGLGGFFVQDLYRQRSDKRRVAKALLHEMLHALEFLSASYDVLNALSKTSGSVKAREISHALPSERKIFATLGRDVGALSDDAAAAAVEFEASMQSLERDFQFAIGFIHEASDVDPETALRLATGIIETLDLMCANLDSLARDAYGGAIPESTRKMIQRLKSTRLKC